MMNCDQFLSFPVSYTQNTSNYSNPSYAISRWVTERLQGVSQS